ncbi:hypothetical protein CQW23_23286 [Capsicum baccatum]|uniref:Uncharacterized protein n=1 Tax=Capsicum baccatum TaxID=33114 RepID=A0A2G2VRJ2_CAPBA|nr:hypothetical protein CQW23_23286 [Capsicum baccatum]
MEVEEVEDESEKTEELMVDPAEFLTMISQELETNENGSILPHVLVHAMNGIHEFRTIRVTIFVKGKVVYVLIEIGSTHNFLDSNTARRLGFMLTTISAIGVSVVDGKEIQSNYLQETGLENAGWCFRITRTSFEVPTELHPSMFHGRKIVLKEGTPPVNIRPYRYPTIWKDEIEKMVNEMLSSGVLRSCTSP